ncbi:MAG: nucleotide exchange factor GrpE, partial [Verrucomicrobiota bacterium]
PVLDNFEMGMQAAAQDEGSMIYVGMDMVRKQLNEFLGNNGVKEIPAEGQAFDPNLHEAVSQEVSEEVGEGSIIRVMRRGFTLRDRLLRPATVVVAKSASEAETGED